MKNTKSSPNTLRELILKVFKKNNNRTLNHKQIAKQIREEWKISRDELNQEIIRDLKILSSQGEITELEIGRYKYKPKQEFRAGTLELTAKGAGFVVAEGFPDDVFISPQKTANALNGDTVKILVYESNSTRKEGEILEILSRAKKDYSGIVEVMQRFAFVITDDQKMPVDIFIPLENLNHAKQGQKVIAQVTDWKRGEKNPTGKIITVLGKAGENDTEMNAILAEYGFPLSFPKNVEEEAEKIPTVISDSEIAKRRDFRGITTFTIDPEDAKDFDDALSIRNLPGGNYEIGVHIADVTHYVKSNSVIDKEAYERGTSIYLVDRVIPMLPEKLSNDVCSLRPNEDKLCFSAVFEINEQAEIKSEWFGRTVIHSGKRFTYEEAQKVLEEKSGVLSKELFLMDGIAKKLRGDRFRKGAISFEKSEVKFRLDEKGNPLGVFLKENKDSNKLIEEFMLLANKRVAEFVGKQSGQKKTFIYRVHDVPVAERITAFSEFAGKFGYKINIKTEKEIAKSLNLLLKNVSGKKEQNMLEQLAIRTMAKAIYTTENIGHYGLAFDYYSHFTSPIRRYPDMMVHDLLQHYLDGNKSVNPKVFEAKCKHATDMEIKASQAERDSIKFKQVQFLHGRIGKEFEGIISGVTEWGLYVEIVENKCEGMIRLRDLKDDYYVYDEKNYCVTGKRKRNKIQFGDTVKVRIVRADMMKRQVDMEMV